MARYAGAARRFASARARNGSALGREGIVSRPSRSPPAHFASPRARDGSRRVVQDEPEFVKAVPFLRSAAPATVQAWGEVCQVTPKAVTTPLSIRKEASWSVTASHFGVKAPRETVSEHFATVTRRIGTVRRRIES